MSTSDEGPIPNNSSLEAPSTTRASMAGNTRLRTLLQALPPLETYLTAHSLQTFTVFPRLPLEFRSRIWRFVAFDSRVIKLVPYNLPTNPHVKGQSQHPSMLHASREARREGMRYYRKCLQKCCDVRTHSQNVPCGKPRNIIYVNFKVDRFHYGIYDRYVVNDGKMAFDWKIVRWGGYNFQIKDMV